MNTKQNSGNNHFKSPYWMRENIPDLLKRHIVFSILAATVVGYGTGIASVQFFLEITDQGILPKTRIADLEAMKEKYIAVQAENEVLKEQIRKEKLEASITTPREGERVIGTIDVRGKASRPLAKDEHLWLFVHHQSSISWEPQSSEIILNNDLTWETQAFIEEEAENIGHKYELVVILANDLANQELNQHLLEMKRTGKWKAMTLPTSGIMRKDKTTIVRQ